MRKATFEDFWLHTGIHDHPLMEGYDDETGGKALIFPDKVSSMNEVFEKIKTAGLCAKMARNEGVICVYASEQNKAALYRSLRELGFTFFMPWKSDGATMRGEYSQQSVASRQANIKQAMARTGRSSKPKN